MADDLVPIEGRRVSRQSDRARLGVVQRRKFDSANWLIE